MQERYSAQIDEGMDVVDRDGSHIGKTGETVGEYFNVDAGFLGTKEYYIPFNAVTEVRDDSIYLDVSKDELDERGWDLHPDEHPTDLDTRDERMELREEELQVRKTSVETGRLHLGRDVVEQPRTMDVPVTREEVYVERRPVDRQTSDRPIDASESETIRVPVREEQVEVEKRPVVYEEVGVGKRITQETQHVSDAVRREELRTDKEGDVNLRADTNR